MRLFQWLRNDVEMPGAILSFLRLESVIAADHGAWVSGGGLSLNSETRVVSFDPAAKINEAAQLVIHTESATWFYDRAGGGISRLIDRSGRDWVAFSKSPLSEFPASAAAGYRSLGNMLFGARNPDAGGGHPGFDPCSSEIAGPGRIRTRSHSGKWQWSWTATETTATFAMELAVPEHPWWFVYEGPVAGRFAPTGQIWGTSEGGPHRDVPDLRNQRFGQWPSRAMPRWRRGSRRC